MLVGEGVSKGAFIGLVVLFFILYIPAACLSFAQMQNIEWEGHRNSHNSYWYYSAYYASGSLAALGAILIGQFKRCSQEVTTPLPKATPNEILAPVVSVFLGGVFLVWAI